MKTSLRRIEDIIVGWHRKAPYLYAYGINTTFTKTNNPGYTMGVAPIKRNWLRIQYGEDFVQSLTDAQLAFVIVHEIFHIIMLTHDRQGSRNALLWNIATDAVNNEILENDNIIEWVKLEPVEGGVFIRDNKIKLKIVDEAGKETVKEYEITGNHTAEAVYENIYEDMKNQMQIQSGEGSPGIENWDDHSELEKAQNGEIERDIHVEGQLRRVENIAQSEVAQRGWGDSSGNMETIIKTLSTPKIHWKTALRKALKSKLGHRGKFNHKSWRRPHRRDLPIQDKMKSEYKVNIIVDTSGSTFNLLPKFFSEVEGILQAYPGRSRLIQFDTKVTSDQPYKLGDWKKIKIKGLGGTCVQGMFDYLKKKNLGKNLNVIFTDGEFSYDFNSHGIHNIVWVTTNEKIPNMKNIKIED